MTPARTALLTAWQRLLGPADASLLVPTASPAVQASVGLLSTCELAAAAALRLAFGLPDPDPYKLGTAAQVLYGITGGSPMAPAEGLRLATLEEPPAVGDGVWFGPSPEKRPDSSPLHPEHVDGYILTVSQDGAVLRYTASAGGQGLHGSYVAEVERVLDWHAGVGRWVCRATGRVVWVAIDTDRVAERLGWVSE